VKISENQELVLGPPGTGKTTTVLNRIEKLMEGGTPPDKIAFVSFTKKAISESVDRACDRFSLKARELPLFRTIHSLAFARLGIGKKDVVGREHMRELGDWLGYKFEGTWDESEGPPIGSDLGDVLLFMDNLARVTERPLREIWEENYSECEWDELERFQDAYQDFKTSKNVLDFTDMLSAYVTMCDPEDTDYVFVDEAQDLSSLQWSVLRHAFQHTRKTTIAGDDDQAIYKWSGADVNKFLALGGDKTVLNQSYRLPSSVHSFAGTLIGKVPNRFEKKFAPREGEGVLDFRDSFETLEIDTDESTMFLVRNVFLTNRVHEYLERVGVPYIGRHGYSSIRSNHVTAIRAVEKLRKREQITGKDVKSMYEELRIGYYLERGHKAKIAVIQDNEVFDFTRLNQEYGLHDLAPWYEMLQGIGEDRIEYYRRVLANGYKLSGQPTTSISTIHSAKGGEANHVVLLSDMAYRSYQEWEKYPDDERRVAYVGATRARDKLTIIQPQTKLFFDYFREGN